MARQIDEFERVGWASRSDTYDSGFGALAAGAHPALLGAAVPCGGLRVLEVGCGTGRLAAAARAGGAQVIATDAVHQMVVRAREVAPGVCAALPELPFRDLSFHAAVGAFVINHVADPPAALGELRRVLRRGGRVALSCWDADERNRALGVFSDAIAEAGAVDSGGLFGVAPFRGTPEAFAALLGNAGLRDVRVEQVCWTHRVTAERWWRDVLGGTVRTAGLIEAQDGATTGRIRTGYDRAVAVHRTADGSIALPAAALVATGAR